MSWLLSFFIGLATGIGLFAIALGRDRLSNRAAMRLGSAAHRLLWLGSLLLMIGAANLALVLLRRLLGDAGGMPQEILFALTTLLTAAALIWRRVHRHH